ncbi:hypothetical protein FB645_000397 [Coemansia sp. IMI 203386]|nr:hypothetical protein FB645_000397 [Coemansia sp. IMI 203386]
MTTASSKSAAAAAKTSVFYKLPFTVHIDIVRTIYQRHYMEYDEHDVYYVDKLIHQQKDLLRISHVNSLFREISKRYLFKELLLDVDSNGEIQSFPKLDLYGAEWTRQLYIKIRSTTAVNPRHIWKNICGSINVNLVSLETIVVDATLPVSPEYTYTDEKSCSVAQSLDKLLSVHVTGRFLESGEDKVTNNAAMFVAKEIVSSLPRGHLLRRLELDEALMSDISYKVMLPFFAYNADGSAENLSWVANGSLTRLLFSDIGLVVEAPDLIKRCSGTLVRLTFMLCDYDVFKEIVYDYTDDPVDKKNGKPIIYANLRSIHGAFNRRNRSSPSYFVSPVTFPKLDFFHEVVEYTWQRMLGAVPHLLANVLLSSWLPQLKMIRLRTAQTMLLDIDKLPQLEYVSYYHHDTEVRNISGTAIAEQFARVLKAPKLQFLRFHDQLPPIRLNANPEIYCLSLRQMDLGLMILSFSSVVYLLGKLAFLHTAAFAVNNSWEPSLRLGDERWLSDSVQKLRLYVIGDQKLFPNGYSSSEEIVSRLPKLLELTLQADVEHAKAFFRNNQNRFEWSLKVAENIRIRAEDLFSRVN